MIIYLALAALSIAQPITLPDFNGVMQNPFSNHGQLATILIFSSTVCPIANAYAPEINRIVSKYSPKNCKFFIIQTEPKVTQAAARKHATDFGFKCPVLLDRGHELAEFANATKTPHAVVYNKKQKPVYTGRINNLYFELGKARTKATTKELRDALDAVLLGKSPRITKTEVVGCFLPTR